MVTQARMRCQKERACFFQRRRAALLAGRGAMHTAAARHGRTARTHTLGLWRRQAARFLHVAHTPSARQKRSLNKMHARMLPWAMGACYSHGCMHARHAAACRR